MEIKTNMSELRARTHAELNTMKNDIANKLASHRFAFAGSRDKNVHVARGLRKLLARILTILNTSRD